MSQELQKRREFLKKGATFAASMIALKAMFFGDSFAFAQAKKSKAAKGAKGAAAAGGCTPPLADPEKGVAKGMNYVHEHSKAPAAIKTARGPKKVPFEKQFCDNCMFYKASGKCDGKAVGTCQVIPGHVVAAKGICQTWAPKLG